MKKLTTILFLAIFLVFPTFCEAHLEKSNSLVVLNAQTKEETETGIKLIEEHGGEVRHVFPPDVLIVYFPERMGIDERLKNNPVISQIFQQTIDPATISSRSGTGMQGIKSWNYLLTDAGKIPIGVEEKEPTPLVGDAFPPINVLGTEDTSKMTSSVGWGSCYEIGRVSVGILFMESNGHAEDWTQEQYDRAMGEIVEGFDRSSSYAYEKRMKVTWFYDIHYGVPTDYEPIQGDHRPKCVLYPIVCEFDWCNDALDYLGYGDGWDGMNEYVNAMRSANQTEWGFIIYLVDDENDPDHKFADGDFAYTWLGGPCLVMTYNNDYWGWWNMDEVVDHEKGHVFGAHDEYTGEDGCGSNDCTTPYGYLDVVNGNCATCNPSSIPCIMRCDDIVYCSYTNGQIGWRDSDGNYIPDPLDMGTQHSQNLWDVYPGDLITIYNELGELVKVISVSPDNCGVRLYTGRSVTLWDATNNTGDEVAYAQYFWKVNGVERGNLLWEMDTHAPYFTEYSFQNCKLYFRLHDEDTAGGYVTITVFDADWNVVGYVMRHKFLTCRDAPGEPLHEILIPSGLSAQGASIKLSCSDGGGNDATPVFVSIDPNQPLDPPPITSTVAIDTSICLEWDDNNCFELGYIIERKDITNDQWTVIDTTTWDVESYTDYQVIGSETYYYRIKAYNYFGSSGYSNTVSKKARPRPPINLFVENFYCNRPYRPIGKISTSTPDFETFPPKADLPMADKSAEKYCEPPYPDSIPSDASEICADYPINQKPGTFAGMEVWSKHCSWHNWHKVRLETTFVNLDGPMLVHTPPDTVYCSDWTYFFKVRTMDIYGDSSMFWPPGELDEIPSWVWPYACCVGPCHINIGGPSNELKIGIPAVFSLEQNYPNPFNPETQIRYALPQDAEVKLIIYNVLGQKVKTLVDEHQTVGYKTVHWDGKDDSGNEVASGIYFYRLQASEYNEVRKMLMVK